ncbi:unnamed protein product, partial [Chrysoparadoxa australica]
MVSALRVLRANLKRAALMDAALDDAGASSCSASSSTTSARRDSSVPPEVASRLRVVLEDVIGLSDKGAVAMDFSLAPVALESGLSSPGSAVSQATESSRRYHEHSKSVALEVWVSGMEYLLPTHSDRTELLMSLLAEVPLRQSPDASSEAAGSTASTASGSGSGEAVLSPKSLLLTRLCERLSEADFAAHFVESLRLKNPSGGVSEVDLENE